MSTGFTGSKMLKSFKIVLDLTAVEHIISKWIDEQLENSPFQFVEIEKEDIEIRVNTPGANYTAGEDCALRVIITKEERG